jgi:acyl carrier protein
MRKNREEIMADVLALLEQLASDWEYTAAITAETRLFADLGFQSLDAVVLGTAIQEQYRQQMPFAEFLAEIGRREVRDISVGELVEFFHQHVNSTPIGVTR